MVFTGSGNYQEQKVKFLGFHASSLVSKIPFSFKKTVRTQGVSSKNRRIFFFAFRRPKLIKNK